MKKQLLFGAFLLAALGAKAQSSCSEAAVLPIGVTSVATIEGEYIQGCWTGEDDAATAAQWYSVTATSNGVFRVNTNLDQNAGGDTRISVYSGTCDELTCWSASDDVYYGGQTSPNNNYLTDFQFPVIAGDTYYIAFDDQWSAEAFDVELSFYPAECTATSLNEDWEDLSTWYFCWDSTDANEVSDTNTAWTVLTDYDFDGDFTADNAAAIFAGSETSEDFLISNPKNLTADVEYTVNVTFNGVDTTTETANQSFGVAILQLDGNQYTLVEDLGGVTDIPMDGAGLGELQGNASTESFTFTPAESGQYEFAIYNTAESGSGALLIFEITVDGVMSVPAVSAPEFAVYPNPANNVVNVSAANDVINNVTLADVNGRTVKTVNVASNNGQINVSDLANGVYMMTISSDKGSVTKKIVKN